MRYQNKIKAFLMAVTGALALAQVPAVWASGGSKPTLPGAPENLSAGRSDLSAQRSDAWAQVPQGVQVLSAESAATMEQSQCQFTGPSGKLPYPAGERTPAGNVVLRLKFVQTDAPPEVEVVYAAKHYLLAKTGETMAKEYRMHCAKPLASPVYATQTIRLRTEGAQGMALKDMEFVSFLQSLDRTSLGKVKFDLNTMACPFDVKVRLIEPFGENAVSEAEAHVASRQEFLSWMRKLVFNYPAATERFLVGESTKVTVPCMVLDLT